MYPHCLHSCYSKCQANDDPLDNIGIAGWYTYEANFLPENPFNDSIETGVRVDKWWIHGNFVVVVPQVLVDGPQSGVPRQAYRLNNLQLTKFKLNFPYHAPTRVVRKQWAGADLTKKWEESAWAQKSKNVKKVSGNIFPVWFFFISRVNLNFQQWWSRWKYRNCRLIHNCS